MNGDGWRIGVDIGGTKIAGGVVDRTGRAAGRSLVRGVGAVGRLVLGTATPALPHAQRRLGDREPRIRGGRPVRRRGVGDRRAARLGNSSIRASGHARGRRARAPAAHLPGPRRPVVDGCGGHLESALRRNRRSDTGAPAAVTAAGRHARADDARFERAE